ncbi:hypothetical protein ACFRH4_29880 [Streptomyces mirabilis]|uniref:hypothetical protein n=1 Tax=Streptomyces mirabilis TaxID=68239 RepID=UPI00368AEBED
MSSTLQVLASSRCLAEYRHWSTEFGDRDRPRSQTRGPTGQQDAGSDGRPVCGSPSEGTGELTESIQQLAELAHVAPAVKHHVGVRIVGQRGGEPIRAAPADRAGHVQVHQVHVGSVAADEAGCISRVRELHQRKYRDAMPGVERRADPCGWQLGVGGVLAHSFFALQSSRPAAISFCSTVTLTSDVHRPAGVRIPARPSDAHVPSRETDPAPRVRTPPDADEQDRCHLPVSYRNDL